MGWVGNLWPMYLPMTPGKIKITKRGSNPSLAHSSFQNLVFHLGFCVEVRVLRWFHRLPLEGRRNGCWADSSSARLLAFYGWPWWWRAPFFLRMDVVVDRRRLGTWCDPTVCMQRCEIFFVFRFSSMLVDGVQLPGMRVQTRCLSNMMEVVEVSSQAIHSRNNKNPRKEEAKENILLKDLNAVVKDLYWVRFE